MEDPWGFGELNASDGSILRRGQRTPGQPFGQFDLAERTGGRHRLPD
jgi:hypothetical protein